MIYTAHDIHFTVLGYVWIAVWYAFALFEMVYVKVVVDSVQMTTWSRTYYQARPRCRHLHRRGGRCALATTACNLPSPDMCTVQSVRRWCQWQQSRA